MAIVWLHRLDVLLPPNHRDARMCQRLRARCADVEPFFFTVPQFADIEMQITDAATGAITLTGNTSIPLEKFMQRVYQLPNITSHISAF